MNLEAALVLRSSQERYFTNEESQQRVPGRSGLYVPEPVSGTYSPLNVLSFFNLSCRTK